MPFQAYPNTPKAGILPYSATGKEEKRKSFWVLWYLSDR
jgi:hypothetical protein